jgi:hypothetical protein
MKQSLEYTIENLLQIELLGKKLKENNSTIINVSFYDSAFPGDSEYSYKVGIQTLDGKSFAYWVADEIDYE